MLPHSPFPEIENSDVFHSSPCLDKRGEIGYEGCVCNLDCPILEWISTAENFLRHSNDIYVQHHQRTAVVFAFLAPASGG